VSIDVDDAVSQVTTREKDKHIQPLASTEF